MSPRSHLPLIRRSRTVAKAERYLAPVRRGVLRVSTFLPSWDQERPPRFVVTPGAVYSSWYDLKVPTSSRFWSGYLHFADLFSQRFVSCPHVRIYP